MTTAVSVADLRTALRVTLPFADRDEYPPFDGVHLVAAHNNLIATATDRYVVGHIRILASGDPLAATILPRRFAKLVRRSLDEIAGNQVALLQRIPDLHGPDLLEVATDGLTLRVRTVKADDAGYRQILAVFDHADSKPAGLDAPINLNPAVVRPFAKVQRVLEAGEARWTFHGPTRPVRVEIGRTFVGLLMPRRFPDNFDPTPVTVGLVKPVRRAETAA